MNKVEEQASALYDQAWTTAFRSDDATSKVFTAQEMVDLGVVHTNEDIMPLLQQLSDTQFVRFLTQDGKTVFSLRSSTTATKLRVISAEDRMIYSRIEDTGITGQWVKTLKQRTGITNQTVLNKALKTLEGNNLIKQIKTVRNPTQKTYILFHLSPGESVTGGPWHTDGELDSELIDIVSETVLRYLDRKCWFDDAHLKQEPSMAGENDDDDDTTTTKKRKRHNNSDHDIEGVHIKTRERATKRSQRLWRPAGWKHYPTADAILHYVVSSGFVRRALIESDMIALLDTLIYSERIEKIGSGYRTIRALNTENKALRSMMAGEDGPTSEEGNGLTQAPCGRCPVFDLCQEGGPVNASNCVYFQDWLRV